MEWRKNERKGRALIVVITEFQIPVLEYFLFQTTQSCGSKKKEEHSSQGGK